jgi:hypothetical protein
MRVFLSVKAFIHIRRKIATNTYPRVCWNRGSNARQRSRNRELGGSFRALRHMVKLNGGEPFSTRSDHLRSWSWSFQGGVSGLTPFLHTFVHMFETLYEGWDYERWHKAMLQHFRSSGETSARRV